MVFCMYTKVCRFGFYFSGTSYHLICIMIYYAYLHKVRESEQLNDEIKNIHHIYC
jgi:hypothetical protein